MVVVGSLRLLVLPVFWDVGLSCECSVVNLPSTVFTVSAMDRVHCTTTCVGGVVSVHIETALAMGTYHGSDKIRLSAEFNAGELDSVA